MFKTFRISLPIDRAGPARARRTTSNIPLDIEKPRLGVEARRSRALTCFWARDLSTGQLTCRWQNSSE